MTPEEEKRLKIAFIPAAALLGAIFIVGGLALYLNKHYK